MSLTSDLLAALEAVARAAIPALPAGTRGVSHGWRSLDTIAAADTPHLLIFDPTERATVLAFRQKRVELGQRLQLIRHGTFDELVADYNALRTAVDADVTLGGVVDLAELALDALAESADTPARVLVVQVTASVEL